MNAHAEPRARVAVVGGGWAGLACAVRATALGHAVTLYEAARDWGGRARTLPARAGQPTRDNGQHILIGGYTATLGLMQTVGVNVTDVLQAVPLSLRFADGGGLAIPPWARRWPASLDVLAGIASARGWSWRDRWSLLHTTQAWQRKRFSCDPACTVAELCHALPARVRHELIDPLCISALNTPPERASGSVFLRVLQDALQGASFGPWRSADLLLPRTDLSALLPTPATRWLDQHGAELRPGQRVHSLCHGELGWSVNGQVYDAVVLACPAWEAARLTEQAGAGMPTLDAGLRAWRAPLQDWTHEAIATVYLRGASLPDGQAMLALRNGPGEPAQFVFDRGQLGLASAELACVVSAASDDKATLEAQVLAQARRQLRAPNLAVQTTVVEKRATFACVPKLQRPSAQIAPGLWAAGDWVQGPYPATLEGAVRSGLDVAARLPQPNTTPAR